MVQAFRSTAFSSYSRVWLCSWSSLRYPFTYLFETDVLIGIKAYETVNATSLAIGDYESLKDAAVDPYVAFRDAYVQYRYRLRKVIIEGGKPAPSGTGGAISPPITEVRPSGSTEDE